MTASRPPRLSGQPQELPESTGNGFKLAAVTTAWRTTPMTRVLLTQAQEVAAVCTKLGSWACWHYTCSVMTVRFQLLLGIPLTATSFIITGMQSDVASQGNQALIHVPVPQGFIGLQPGNRSAARHASAPNTRLQHTLSSLHAGIFLAIATDAFVSASSGIYQRALHLAGCRRSISSEAAASGIPLILDLACSMDNHSASMRMCWWPIHSWQSCL